MEVICGWASQSEKKTKDGKKGDQTKTEVRIGQYYDFNQKNIIRLKNLLRRQRAAKAMIAMCKNDNIGYGQADRISLFNQCVKIGWDISKISKIGLCNCDCSEIYACAINFAYGKIKIPSSNTTSSTVINTVKKYPESFKQIPISKIKGLSDLRIGDGVLAAGHHIIMVVDR